MHERSLMNNLMRKIDAIAVEQQARKITCVYIKMGALCHISPDHFIEHFVHSSVGTIAENARIEIDVMEDISHPQAQDILLDKVDLQ
jgi:hydrogenase nickel incorporation protein HypA/HybF